MLAGKYIDLHQAFSGNGARAQLWSGNEGSNQRWILTDVTDSNSICPSEAQLEKKLKAQTQQAEAEAKKEAKKAVRKGTKTTAKRTCKTAKKSEAGAAAPARKPRARKTAPAEKK